MESCGYDPRSLSPVELAVAEAKRIAEWTSGVRASPLWKRERLALLELLKTRGEWVCSMHFKGASLSTFERLQARGYVISKMGPWHYPDTGKPGPRDTEHWKLTGDGEKAALSLDD